MNQIPQMKRVDSVDALRGFAVVAIMLLHFVEHFIYGVYPEATSKTAELLNQSVWDALFFIFAGKSYTVFALLFGFTFIVQQRNRLRRTFRMEAGHTDVFCHPQCCILSRRRCAAAFCDNGVCYDSVAQTFPKKSSAHCIAVFDSAD